MKVLIVDDSKGVGRRMAEMLTEFPEIELLGQVEDGLQALDAIRRLQPDVVILDIHLPGRGGIDILRDIKQESPASLVMIYTNYPYAQYRDRCAKIGADFFFDKSIEFGRVRETFKQLLDRRSRSSHFAADRLTLEKSTRVVRHELRTDS